MTQLIKQRIEQIRRGEVPEGYKKTKVGIVPEEWEEKRIGDVLAQRKTLMCVSEDAPLLSFTIEEGVIDPADKKSNKRDFLIKDMSSKKFALTEVGDIIYNPANLKFGAIHRNNLRRGLVSPIYGIFYGEQNSIFMGYLLHNQKFIDYAKTLTEGTVEKLKTLKADTFLKLKITLPSLTEQEKIAEILTTQDKLIELQQKKIDELKRLKKVYLSKMFPKKGCNVPEVRFPGFIDPWEQHKAKELCNIGTGKSNTQDQVEDGIYPFYIRSDIPVKSNKYLYDCEAVITIGDGNIGRVFHYVNGKFDLHQRCYKMTDFQDIWGKYFYYFFSTRFYNRAMKMTAKATVDSVRLEMISEMDIWKPIQIDEQKRIAEFFTNLDNLITLHQRKLEEEQKKKKALMQLLLTGIVRV